MWSVVSEDVEDTGTVTLDGEVIGDAVVVSVPNDEQTAKIDTVDGADVTVNVRTADGSNHDGEVTATVIGLVE